MEALTPYSNRKVSWRDGDSPTLTRFHSEVDMQLFRTRQMSQTAIPTQGTLATLENIREEEAVEGSFEKGRMMSPPKRHARWADDVTDKVDPKLSLFARPVI